MRLTLSFLFISFILSHNSLAKDNSGKNIETEAKKITSQFKIVKITFKEGETLGKLISLFVKRNSIISRKEAMVQKTLNRNKHIKNWRKINVGETIYLYLDKKFIDQKKYDEFVSKKKKKKKKKKKVKEFHQNASFQFGSVDIKKESEDLKLSFAKFGYTYSNKWNKEYNYSAGIKLTRFVNFEYSEGSNPVSPDGFYTEFTFSIGRVKPFWEKVFLSAQYDMLNYFVVGNKTNDDVTFNPLLVHRVSIAGFYPHTKKLGFFLTTGILKSIGETDITGGDFATGSKYSFGKDLRYDVSGAIYGSSLTTSTTSESSLAVSITTSIGF